MLRIFFAISKTIIFDLDRVYFTDGTRAAIDAIAAGYSIARQAVEDVLNGDFGQQYRVGVLSAEPYWRRAKTQWDIQESAEKLSLFWCSSYRTDEGTVGLVKRLRNTGHELLYLSDNAAERVAFLD